MSLFKTNLCIRRKNVNSGAPPRTFLSLEQPTRFEATFHFPLCKVNICLLRFPHIIVERKNFAQETVEQEVIVWLLQGYFICFKETWAVLAPRKCNNACNPKLLGNTDTNTSTHYLVMNNAEHNVNMCTSINEVF